MVDVLPLDQANVQEYVNRASYDQWSRIEAEILTPIDKVSDFKKYVIKSYLYTRSRLCVPGRCHEDNDHGMLSVGSSAHLEVIDLDVWLEHQDGEVRQEVLDWINDSGLEQVAAARGERHASTHHRRRNKALNKLSEHERKLNLQGAT